MKIIIGAHGVGKTTLCQLVSKKLPHIYCSDGFSRPVQETAKWSGLDGSQVQTIINDLSLWRWNQDLGKTSCLYTRSIIDCIIYTRLLYPYLSVEPLMTVFQNTYDLVQKYFYIPIEVELQGDEARPSNPEFQLKVDEQLQLFLKKYNIKLIKINGTIEQRYEQIVKHLN